MEKLETHGAGKALVLRGEVFADLMLGLGDQLSSGGRGWCAQVGYKVGDGEVGLMSYGGNDWKAARCNRAGDAFGIEGRQVFKRATAACNYDEVD
jgi:hypothetical protein